ncbi:hypothetical protein L1987_77469 [Smallanthus sonchifolius]|uniref:Uncharacterized protein n=1 Tax=Smallanthus sonchifolius TaxID=185202 RepID=A0ACB8ZAY2_9ASTR|nr:hypothetical protein L1987_77469 [Smallanthus sonchifolius]
MVEEFSAITRNGTWTLVPRVSGTNVVNCKWVYKLKRDQSGAIKRYKARLVAKGFNQQPGIDYTETFSPVVKSATIRVVLSLAVTRHWPLRQLDAPRAWFQRLSQALLQLGFTGSKTDPSLFIYSANGTLLYMLVYVDDIILTGNNTTAIDRVVQCLSQSFAVQDMGPLSYFLGIEVAHKGENIVLSQRKYIHDLLSRNKLSNSKPVPSLCTSTAKLALGDSALFEDPVKYRQ